MATASGSSKKAAASPGASTSTRLLCCDLEHGFDEARQHMTSLKLPSKMQVFEKGKLVNIDLSSGELVACLGLPPPPGGWYGPFGFFRLVSYGFMAMTVLGGIFFLLSMLMQDVFGAFASILLTAGAVVAAISAYAHEGLADQVTKMASQNDEFSKKNEKLTAQLKELDSVTAELNKVTKDMGVSEEQLRNTLEALHRQTSLQQLMAMLSAFTDADQNGDDPNARRDQRLTASEVSDFFDSSDAILVGACPTFDFMRLKTLAMTTGIGLYAMRFMVNALIAAGDDTPHKSTAELSLIMFAFDPEHQLEACLASLTLVFGVGHEAKWRKALMEKKKKAIKAEHGRIPCQELHDISQKIMTHGEGEAGASRDASATSSKAAESSSRPRTSG